MLEIPGNGGLLDAVQDLDFMPGFNFEGFPNRDSTMYIDEYSIQSAKTVLRGTIRYKVKKKTSNIQCINVRLLSSIKKNSREKKPLEMSF